MSYANQLQHIQGKYALLSKWPPLSSTGGGVGFSSPQNPYLTRSKYPTKLHKYICRQNPGYRSRLSTLIYMMMNIDNSSDATSLADLTKHVY